MRFWTTMMAALLVAGAAHAADGPAPDPKADIAMPQANWLFVVTADSASIDGKTLTLKGVSPQIVMFSDRPERLTGDASTAGFISYWTGGKGDFQRDPPNATLSTTVNGKVVVAVVELTAPKLDGDTLTYSYRVLGDTKPEAGADASLFIDWWVGAGGGGCWRGPYGGLHCRPRW
ncbi:hypothetical protein [Azorhizobium doebereinerae]|uniref:hypothetical protein n=1 Tax=Azorhizobium doebereinerae TaxID=281091 RepID=UPI00040C3BC0|nr:hypothetical protein [Azorhizobium doebereinerae]